MEEDRIDMRRLVVRGLLLCSMLLGVCVAASRAQSVDLVNGPVDPGARVLLHGQRAPWARPQSREGSVPGDTSLEHLTIVLKRSPQRQRAFEEFLRQQQNPASPSYHRWLTSEQIGKKFGASQHDIDAVSQWLHAAGLQVKSVANSRMMIDFNGTAATVSEAFGAEMGYYPVGGENRMAMVEDPKIPAALGELIRSVSGLYTIKNRPLYGAGLAQMRSRDAGLQPYATFCGGSCNYIFPNDFSTIYDLNSVYGQGIDGTGQKIGIIGRARVYTPDVENFESLSGLAKKDPTVVVPPAGVDPGAAAGAGGSASEDQLEATLDVLRATSVAPGATVDLIVSKSSGSQDGIAIAAEYLVDTDPVPAQIMNISFGECEAIAGSAGVQFWDTLFSQAAGEGISVFVASGDAGVAGCDPYFQAPPQNQIASPNYICSSSYSTCVGGTEFADAGNPGAYWSQSNGPGYESALSYIPEGAWNEPLDGNGNPQAAASGGGVSAYVATPDWQSGVGVPGTQGRYTPDIAFTSAAHDGYFGCLAADGGDCILKNGSFHFEYFFGTSAAAPDMAGITALLNQKFQSAQGELNQRLYQLAATPANLVFHDVTVGSSGVTQCVLTTPSMCNNSTPSPTLLTGGLSGYLVTSGFDEATGLGSIDAANLVANWVPAATFSIDATPLTQTVSSGGAATITITVTPQGTYTSPISFSATLSPTSNAQIRFNPSTVTPNGGTATTILTIQGANPAAGVAAVKGVPLKSFFLFTSMGLAGLVFARGRSTTHGTRISAIVRFRIVIVVLPIALTWLGCGGGSSVPVHTPQTYTVQITATGLANGGSGAVTSTAVVSFTAQ